MRILLLLASLVLGIAPATAQQLKIATLAPDGSSWMNSLREAAGEVQRRTDGRVRVRFYPGGVMGDAATLLRRIRLGQLHGGTFTVGELADIAPESNLYSLPFQFNDRAELAALREEFDPFILQALADGGMIAPAISNNGFAYLFSRQRVAGAEDISRDIKAWVMENDPLSRRVLERIGVSAVSMGIAEVYTGLQTGTINMFGSTLSGAIILQWYTRARYMLDLPILVTATTLAVDRNAFERLEPADREVWNEVFGEALRVQESRARQDNAEAREALGDEGIEFVEPAPAALAEWRRISDRVVDDMLDSGAFEVPGIERLRTRLAELRAAGAGSPE